MNNYMKLKLFHLTCAAVFLASTCVCQTTNTTLSPAPFVTNGFPFIERHDLDAGTALGYSTLSIDNPVIEAGKSISMEVHFLNQGMGRDFLNPFFLQRNSNPGQIALYDGDHNYIGDLLMFHSGSAILSSFDQWTFIPNGGSVGMTLQVRLFYPGKQLQPGNYYLQLIYYRAFIALNPPWSETDPELASKRERLKEFEAHFDRSELFRSNPVKITITR